MTDNIRAMIERSEDRIVVQNAFAWSNPELLYHSYFGSDWNLPETELLVRYNTFVGKPKWWQVRKLWRAAKAIWHMPTIDAIVYVGQGDS